MFLALVLVALAVTVVGPVAATVCKPIKIAEATPCVQDQIKPLRDSGIYDETVTVTDNGNGTYTVTFVFDPKCLKLTPPCGLPSRNRHGDGRLRNRHRDLPIASSTNPRPAVSREACCYDAS
ncbi:MAG TPA: hypothetical protein VF789_09080 [Thermoanaerobaculia bacterium]